MRADLSGLAMLREEREGSAEVVLVFSKVVLVGAVLTWSLIRWGTVEGVTLSIKTNAGRSNTVVEAGS